ncbi:unnamed protein product, partial [Laminaria digitata]
SAFDRFQSGRRNGPAGLLRSDRPGGGAGGPGTIATPSLANHPQRLPLMTDRAASNNNNANPNNHNNANSNPLNGYAPAVLSRSVSGGALRLGTAAATANSTTLTGAGGAGGGNVAGVPGGGEGFRSSGRSSSFDCCVAF